MVYSNKKAFLFIALILSFGIALVLSLPHNNLTTQIDEIGFDVLLIWGLPVLPLSILQAGNKLVGKEYPDRLYISLFSLFWLVCAFTVVLEEVY